MAAGELGRTVAVSAAEAAAAARDAAEAFDALGERTHRYCALYMQARCAEHIGDLEATRQAEAALWAMEDGTLPAAVLHRGRLRRAREHLREGRLAAAVDLSMPEVARLRAAGDLYAAWQANFPLMMSLVLLDRTAEALASTHAVIGEVRALGMQRHCWNELALHLIAAVEHGDVEEARATLRELLPTLLAIDALPWPGHQLAWLPLFAGEAAAAARVHGWLFARSAERGLRSSPLDARGRDRLAERLQQHFSAGALDALKAEGAALTAPQVAELLLRD